MTDVARAAVLTEFGKPLEIRKFPILGPEPGGLVVAVEAATVCGTDVAQLARTHFEPETAGGSGP